MVKVNGRSTKQQKTQQKQGKKKNKVRQRMEIQGGSTSIPQNVAAHPYAYARLDPFDKRARGAKVPDFDNNASVAGDFVYDLGITTNAQGNACVIVPFWPVHLTEFAQWSTTNSRFELTTGGVGTLPQSGAFFTGWDECVGCRMVGAGLKIRSGMNANSVTGNMYITPMSTAEMKAWKSQAATGGYTFTDIKNRKGTIKKSMAELTAGQEVKCNSSVLDPTALNYLAPEVDILTANLDMGDFPNYIGFVVTVESAATTYVADLQLVLHMEWIPGKQFNWMTTRPEPANSALLEKVNNYAEMAPSIITTLGDIAGNVFQAVKTGISVAGTLGLIAL